MYTFLTELQKRPDGIINSSVTPRSSLATGLALYYDRASKAVTSEQFVQALGNAIRQGFTIKTDA